jgi:hypothetical protein
VNQGERLAALEEQMKALVPRVDRLEREIHGTGNGGRTSIRTRLHELANAVTATRGELAERERGDRDRSSWRLKLIVAAIAVWGALIPTLNLVLNLRAAD